MIDTVLVAALERSGWQLFGGVRVKSGSRRDCRVTSLASSRNPLFPYLRPSAMYISLHYAVVNEGQTEGH